MGAELLCKTVCAIGAGVAVRTAQNHNEATYAPPLNKELSPIDWSQSAYNIKCKVRGLNPWPVATAEFSGVTYKIFKADIGEVTTSGNIPGGIISSGKHGLEVGCADGSVIIRELQAPGGKRMAAAEYLRGVRGALARELKVEKFCG